MLLAGFIGPDLGISANVEHQSASEDRQWGKTIAAVCVSLVGTAFILREVLASKKSERA